MSPPETLPIFPLPMAVLPSEYQLLHIFEDRYKKLVRDCRDRHAAGQCPEFGVVFCDSGGLSCTGTSVAITHILKEYDDGRFEIVARGKRRFQVRRVRRLDLYDSAEVEWFDSEGNRLIRSGDVGRLDEDGFIVLGDRKKDMIISGGFNIYPSDIEAVLAQHPQVAECAVIGVPSEQWGETPVAYVVPRAGAQPAATELRDWLNTRVGKTQRVADLRLADQLPRSEIGKVLKRALRDEYVQAPPAST